MSRLSGCFWSGAIAGAVLLASPTVAHHSYAMFDGEHERTLDGYVQSVAWSNPHVSFKMDVPRPGAAPQSWDVESHSPAILSHYHWSSKTLRKGMHVSVSCYPLRDGAPGCRLLTLVIVDTGQKLETKLSQTPPAEREFK